MQDTHLNHIGYNVGGIYGRSNSPPEADCKPLVTQHMEGSYEPSPRISG